MGRAVRQFEKEVSFRLETMAVVSFKQGKGVENVSSNCIGRVVRQFEKRLVLNKEKGYKMLHRTVWDAPSTSWKKKPVLD